MAGGTARSKATSNERSIRAKCTIPRNDARGVPEACAAPRPVDFRLRLAHVVAGLPPHPDVAGQGARLPPLLLRLFDALPGHAAAARPGDWPVRGPVLLGRRFSRAGREHAARAELPLPAPDAQP